MPTIIGHSAAALAIQQTVNKKTSIKIVILSLLCGFFPDVDIIGFSYGIAYESLFGHRGFTHSFFFSALLAFVITFGFFPKLKVRSKQFFLLFMNFFLVTASHGLLDMLTNGGCGIALFSPFSNFRFFFPWRPIPVSYLGVNSAFSPQGLYVMIFEIIFLLIPSLLYIFGLHFLRKNKK